MNRRNLYFGKWIKRSGYYPDPKLRLIKRGAATFELRDVHEDMKMAGELGHVKGDMIHHAYPTLESFIEHANRYSSLGADMVSRERKVGFSVVNIVLRPLVRFIWAYFFRGGFLDGREGLLVLMNHAAYVSWKYAKAWEKIEKMENGSRNWVTEKQQSSSGDAEKTRTMGIGETHTTQRRPSLILRYVMLCYKNFMEAVND